MQPATAPSRLIDCMESATLRPRYWLAFGLIALLLICELFDFFVVGYLVSAVAPAWQLSFGQTTLILLSAGVGAISGALACGALADRVGRKRVLVGAAFLCCVSAGSIAFAPDRSWLLFALLRFFVGFGYGGCGSCQFALIAEYTPLGRRTLLTSSMGFPAGLGLLAASLVVSTLFALLGWRGTAALGYLPLLVVAAIALWVPESPRWLLTRGRCSEALRSAASMLTLPQEVDVSSPQAGPVLHGGGYGEVFADRRRFWLIVTIQVCLGAVLTGVLLWGPTILAQLLHVTPQTAATYFLAVSLSALAGRAAFTFLPHRIGRVASGKYVGYAGAAALALAGVFHHASAAGLPLFFVFLLLGQFFYDGGFSNLTTYAAELYPVRLGAQAMGVSASAAGAGKIIGPLALGLIAGTGNLVTPQATEQAVLPAFLFLAACCLLVGVSYSVLGVETAHRPLDLA